MFTTAGILVSSRNTGSIVSVSDHESPQYNRAKSNIMQGGHKRVYRTDLDSEELSPTQISFPKDFFELPNSSMTDTRASSSSEILTTPSPKAAGCYFLYPPKNVQLMVTMLEWIIVKTVIVSSIRIVFFDLHLVYPKYETNGENF